MVISMVSTNRFFAVLEMEDQNMANATSNTSSRATIHWRRLIAGFQFMVEVLNGLNNAVYVASAQDEQYLGGVVGKLIDDGMGTNQRFIGVVDEAEQPSAVYSGFGEFACRIDFHQVDVVKG
jgi:hypothetical protein